MTLTLSENRLLLQIRIVTSYAAPASSEASYETKNCVPLFLHQRTLTEGTFFMQNLSSQFFTSLNLIIEVISGKIA